MVPKVGCGGGRVAAPYSPPLSPLQTGSSQCCVHEMLCFKIISNNNIEEDPTETSLTQDSTNISPKRLKSNKFGQQNKKLDESVRLIFQVFLAAKAFLVQTTNEPTFGPDIRI